MPERADTIVRNLDLFPELCPVTEAVEELALSGIEARGAIFTRREVVDFILDLIGYTADQPLFRHRLLEPSFGAGDFLLVAIGRLVESWKRAGNGNLAELEDAVRAVELHRETFEQTGKAVLQVLVRSGFTRAQAAKVAERWLVQDDFLLTDLEPGFDYVIGNPPYVRQELIPDVLIREYRHRYRTVFDRADIYIPFIERSLTLLRPRGSLAFICADRWMKNRYGGPLRKMIAESYHLKAYIDMVDTPAFHSEVIAYPAITIIVKERCGKTRIAHRPAIDQQELKSLAERLTSKQLSKNEAAIKEVANIVSGTEPWILESSDQLLLVRRLEQEYPLLEDAGCKVGIGVATGADGAFIAKMEELDVEEDRKLPLVMTRDILNGEVQWRGFGVINPFADQSGLVDLKSHPKLKRYLEARREEIAGRHVAQKAPANWYRTIDRIYPALAKKPKLLIPDIKGDAHIVYEGGQLYPHHNLYYITSDEWDLKALQGVLRSGIARLFIATYSTKMRGGYLRFQAQYLRRIRLPKWKSVSSKLKSELISAAQSADVLACNNAVFRLYKLNKQERAAIGGNGE